MPPKKATDEEQALQKDPTHMPSSGRKYDDSTDRRILELAHEHRVLASVTGPKSMTAKDVKWEPVIRDLCAAAKRKQRELCAQYLDDLAAWEVDNAARMGSANTKGMGRKAPQPSLTIVRHEFEASSVAYRFNAMQNMYAGLVKKYGLYRHQQAGESGGGVDVQFESKLAAAEKEWPHTRLFHAYFAKLPSVDTSLSTAVGVSQPNPTEAPMKARSRRKKADPTASEEEEAIRANRASFFYNTGEDDHCLGEMEGKQGSDEGFIVSPSCGADAAGSDHSGSDYSPSLKQGRANGQGGAKGTNGSNTATKRKQQRKKPAAVTADDIVPHMHVGPKRQKYSKGQSKADAAQKAGLGGCCGTNFRYAAGSAGAKYCAHVGRFMHARTLLHTCGISSNHHLEQ
jgi:hypothetical protein